MNFFQSFRRPKEGPEDLARGLLRLVTERKQLAVMSILVSDQIKDAPKLISDCAEASGEPSFLHFVLKTNPPVEMVEMILVSMDDCESCTTTLDLQQDKQGRTPLHVAAEYGCESDVVEVLLKEKDGCSQARMTDREGRYPLHALCANPKGLHVLPSGQTTMQEKFMMRDTLALIIDAYPKASIVQDYGGNTPYGLAEENGADRRFLDLLNDAVLACAASQRRKSASSIVPSEVSDGGWSNGDLSSLGFEGEDYERDGDSDGEDIS